MPVIVTLIIAIFLILISWTWNNLGNIDKTKKIITIVISLILMFFVTFIIFNISKQDIQYGSNEQMEVVRNVLVILFTIINGLIVMPFVAKTINKVYEKEIEKEQASKRLIAILVIFIIVVILECGYLKSIQQEILKIYNHALIAK